jgi:hypothetical protein
VETEEQGEEEGEMTRKSTGKKARFEIFKRDKFTCQYCGAHPPEVVLVVDHVDPVANGGSSDIDNLVTACETCNQGKGARELTSVPESLAAKAARVAESEEQLLGYQEILRGKADRLEDEMWQVAEVLWPGCSEKGANRRDLASIKSFVSKIGLYPCLEFAEIAKAWRPWADKRMFLYFCGCCWKRIKGEPQ